jgi:hypothetical protein
MLVGRVVAGDLALTVASGVDTSGIIAAVCVIAGV